MDINQQEDFQNEIEAQELKVATRIQEEQLARKLSQLDLALEAGISHKRYEKFCSGFENNIQYNFRRRRTKGLRQSFRKMVTKISTCNETLV